ncbi:hypothetical protein DOX33_11380 [Cronobacter sakazakii]|nr:hypothetical protein [Cronobacter sakazakii]PUY63918.1 hypothetical protein AUM53_14205 [Cronobacter sakazakii]
MKIISRVFRLMFIFLWIRMHLFQLLRVVFLKKPKSNLLPWYLLFDSTSVVTQPAPAGFLLE